MDVLTSPDRQGLAPELWQLLADHIPQLAWVAAADGDIFWYNRRWYEYTGTTLDEMQGWGWKKVHHPDEVDRVERHFREALSRGEPWEDIFPLRGADGRYRQFLSRAEPVRDANGCITHWFGTNTDLTDHKGISSRDRFFLQLEDGLAGHDDPVEIRRIAVEALGLELGADRVMYTLVDPSTGSFMVGHQFLAPGVESIAGRYEGPEFRPVFEAYSRGEPVVASTIAAHPIFAGLADHPIMTEWQLKALLDVPMLEQGKLQSVLSVHQKGERQWTALEIELVTRTARRTADRLRRLEAERALAESNRRFAAVLDNTKMAVFLMDDRQHCVFANAAAEKLTGYRFDEMQGRALHDVIHHKRPDGSHFPLEECPIDRAFPERAKMQGEELFVAPDGSFYPVAFTASPVLDDAGRPVGTVIEARDITEERAAKAALEASEARFRTTAEAVPGLLFVTNAAGENTYVNQFYRDYTGLSEQVIGDWWRGVIHPDDLDRVLGVTQRSRETGEDFVLDYRIRRHDGEYRWHSTKATPTRDEQGEVVRWVGVSLDINDRREAEERARAAAEEIEVIYATAPVGLTVLDRELRYVRINERLAEINGIPAADHIGRTVREIVPDIADQAEAALRLVLTGQEVWGLELTGETPAQPGVVRTWRENWLPVRDADGEVSGIAISAEEITSAKAAERALAQSEAQFRTLAEALPGMLFIAKDGGNVYVNETFAAYTGMPKEALLGAGWVDSLSPDDFERCREVWEEAGRTGRPYEVECRFRRHDGAYRWHAVRALRIPPDEAGVSEMWVGTCVDIHDSKVAEQEIAAAEARYRAVFEQAGVGVARVSPDGPFLEINDRYCEILQRSREDLLGHGWKEITHPDDLQADIDQVDAMLRGESDGFALEKRYVAPDGSDIWVNLTVGAQRDEDGKVLFFIPVVEDLNARKAAEAAVRASEERYRTLFESMDQGFCVVQVSFDEAGGAEDYRFVELNPAFSRHTGLAQDVLHRSVSEAVPGLERSWFDRYGQVAWTGQPTRFVDHAEPLGRWFEVYAFPIGPLEERNVAILFSDVTERIRQEEALRRSEQELRLRLNAIPQMVWSSGSDGQHDFYNDRWYEFTGTPLGSTDGEGWNGMFHPDDQARAWERWKRSLATGEPYEIEYRLRHHDGTYRWVLGRALPIRNEAGAIVRWMGTCTDIDDRVSARLALQQSEARLRAVIESMPVGLVFANERGEITGGNRMIEEFLGHDLIETEDTSDYAKDYVAYHGDGRPVASAEYPLVRVIESGEQRPELECRVQRADGSLIWLRYVAAPIHGPDGRLLGGVVASIDIDREKRLTEGLEREVEKVIAEREAAQEALRQSQKLEAMGQLTGGVAHDFNNLLTPIIGSLDLLHRKQVLDQRTGRLVEGALASAEKARVLVQRLLAFARRQPLKPQPIDVARIVTEMSELIDSTSGPRVRVLTEVPDQLPPALADGNQLEMALLNLSVNARDAMPDGGTLTIAARLEGTEAGKRLGLPHRPHVVLSVSDTGLGMDEETRRRAIEPFFSTKGIGKGTGLGLSMVHGLAAQLGGGLDIRSAPGMGTSIELWLPLASGSVAAEDQPPEAERQGAGTALLVDDEELVRASTAGMLADLGYEVVEAESGEAAAALVAKGLRPSLLVTDQLMPGLSGTDLAVQLRERMPDLPVLIVSGYADLDSLSPAFPHLSKPFRQAELAAALEKVTS